MTPQVIIGIVFVLIGIGVEIAKAAGMLGSGEIGYVAEVSNLGFLLLGKELLNKSAAAQAKDAARRSIPPAAGALLVLPLLFGCAGTPTDAALQNRLEANALRAEVNEASDVLAQAHGALPFVCAYLGPDSAACVTLEDSYRVLASAVDTAHRAIDLLDAVGVGAVQTRTAVERVLSEAETFGASVQRAGEEVQYAIENHRRDRDAGGEGLGRGLEPSPEAAPAEDAGPQPAAAP